MISPTFPLKRVILVFCALMCAFSCWLHFFSPLDLQLQRIFFNNQKWLIDPHDPFFRFFFYDFPKMIIALMALTSLALLILNWFKIVKIHKNKSIGLLTFLICALFFPILINILKDILRQPCPRDLVEFGGPYSGTLFDYLMQRGPIRCFPGAHASAPFSLLGLMYLFEDKYNRGLYLLVLIPLATMISMYQVVRGVHFVSDTTFSAFSAVLFMELSHRLATILFHKIKV